MYNHMETPRIPRLTKPMAEQYIAMHINNPNVIYDFIRLTESPVTWKHACFQSGVKHLQVQQIQYHMTVIYFTYCPYCFRVSYYYEL